MKWSNKQKAAREKMCIGKSAFPTKREARKANKGQRHYQCWFCHQWHNASME